MIFNQTNKNSGQVVNQFSLPIPRHACLDEYELDSLRDVEWAPDPNGLIINLTVVYCFKKKEGKK